ncbi:hypothetical protein L0F63_000028 [Massospora cicadina]|nr:hypothetical protein L0F63_000028 [Massospora cicadina]
MEDCSSNSALLPYAWGALTEYKVVEPVTYQERREATQAIRKAEHQRKKEEARKEKQEKEADEKATEAKDSERMDQDTSEAPHVWTKCGISQKLIVIQKNL